LRLDAVPRDSGYTIFTPDGEYLVCSRPFAACSGLVPRRVSALEPAFDMQVGLSGAVYGAGLASKSNTQFVHALGSHFLIDSVMLNASLILFEDPTLDNNGRGAFLPR
jgi:hypothetical protein